MRKTQFGFLIAIFLCLTFTGTALSYYYPATHIPPGAPPNYTQIDGSYFLGTPSIPLPPPEKGGIYVWYDQGMWHVANHIYSPGNSLEQFHCCILAILDQPPTPNVNVFAEEFELIAGDATGEEPSADSADLSSTCPKCLEQNDRWGWKPWGNNLYEIWWDVTTKEWKDGSGDPNDFMKVIIAGAAVDFNLWSSAHSRDLDADQIFLGAAMTPLSNVTQFSDYFPGVSDPYQPQAGTNPTADPNITIFTKYSDTLRSYNKNGLIDSTDSYSCCSAVNYGQRYAGTFAYEGNGVQFSAGAVPPENHPPHMQLPSDTSVIVCVAESFCIDVFASDPDPQDTITVEKILGAGDHTPLTEAAPISDTHCFFPDTSGSYMFIFEVTDKNGLSDADTTMVTVDINDPPILTLPADFDTLLCDTGTVCFEIEAADPEDNAAVSIDSPGYYNPSTGSICFPAYEEKSYCFEVVATDDCGESDSDGVCINVGFSNSPVVDAPHLVFVPQEQTAEYSMTAYDPDGQILEDNVNITVNPDCGEYSVERLAGWGTSSGEWKITFQATDCAVGWDTVVVEVQNSCGKVGSDTTLLGIQPRVNNAPVVTVPEKDSGYVGDTVKYNAEAFDPDDDSLLDNANIIIEPDCGNIVGSRLAGKGTSSGSWEIVFYTLVCDPGTYRVIVEIEDALGAKGAGTTYVELKQPSGVDEESSERITNFLLKQNYPNPFNLNTEISFLLPYQCKADLKIYNLKGQLVKTIVEKEMNGGAHTVFWDGTDNQGNPVASGIYFYKLKTPDFTSVRKMILLK